MPKDKNNFLSILSRLNGSVWYIREETMDVMLGILERRMRNEALDPETLAMVMARQDERQYSDTQNVRGIGVLPLHGPIFPKANLMTQMSGATSIEEFRADFRSLMANDFVSTIVMDVDSPGGHADMIPEMAAEIRAARDIKPIIAVANTNMCSAAMFLAAQASKVYSTESGMVGSIGTLLVHTDESRKDEIEGIKKTYIHAGEYKTELAGPLSEGAKGRLQDWVDHHYAMFVNNMAEGRGTTAEDVIENYGKGSILTPAQAQSVGMIDGVQSLDHVLGRLIESGGAIEAIDSSSVGVSEGATRLTLRDSYDADKEHSEPGTGQGGEPTPREPPETGDPAIEGGWRRDPPPIAYEPEESVMGRDRLETLAATLGLQFSAETPDEELAELVEARVGEVVTPIAEATAQAEAQRKWEQDYPEQARQMARLLEDSRKNEAHSFAEAFASFGDDPQKGFSPIVREELEKAHLSISDRTFGHDDLKGLVEAMASKTSIVSYGEAGSARSDAQVLPVDGNARQQFAALVRNAMTEHGMTQKQAVQAMSQQNPDLARAYMETGR